MTTLKIPLTGSGGATALIIRNATFDVDPTDTPPAYEFTASTSKASGSFTNGEWDTTYDSDTKVADPLTPSISLAGDGGQVTVTVGVFKLWGKYTDGSIVDLVDHGLVEFT